MNQRISASDRRANERRATELRLEGLRRGFATEEIVNRILGEVPDILPLEAWRFANGWTRPEVSARLDLLYQSEGLAPPEIDSATICRWEHGERRPGDERIDYLCRLYRTRPDRLGFGNDHGLADIDNLQRAGIVNVFPYTTEVSEADLIDRIRKARDRINMFGLTRNFYGNPEVLPVLEAKAAHVPIQIFVMDPYCDSRKDRYRIEPAEAAMEDPDRYVREILRPLGAVSERQPNLQIYVFNFPCSFAIEEVDDVVRVMLYGHGKRGTQGPIITWEKDTASHAYFVDQIRWLERLAQDPNLEPWASKGIVVSALEL